MTKVTRHTVEEIIENEKLNGYNFFEDRADIENEVVIKKKNEKWVVYVTDERASIITGSKVFFDNEEEAIENFLRRLRGLDWLKKNYDGL